MSEFGRRFSLSACDALTRNAVCKHFQHNEAFWNRPSENVVFTHSRSFSHQTHLAESSRPLITTFIFSTLQNRITGTIEAETFGRSRKRERLGSKAFWRAGSKSNHRLIGVCIRVARGHHKRIRPISVTEATGLSSGYGPPRN